MAPTYIGIDAAKDHLDVCARPSGQAWRVANDPDGIDALALCLTELQADLVVMEGTGGHEHAVAATLAAAELTVAVVNPRQVRDFAKVTGGLAKTDALDAAVLALFAERVRPEPCPQQEGLTASLRWRPSCQAAAHWDAAGRTDPAAAGRRRDP